MMYFRIGPKERSIGVTATNFNVPGLPYDINYLRQTIETLEEIGYEVPDTAAEAAVQVRVTAKYTQVDNSQAVAGEVGGRAAAGAVLGALTGLALGGGGRGAAQGAAGGAVFGAATGAAATPPVLRYITLEFNVSSRKGGSRVGQVTKDITNLDVGMEQFIDATIAEYLEAAFPKR
jgi:outer membrane lipoprotein SlyB